MRVGCIGAGGTGKTTTLQMVTTSVPEEYYPGVMRGVYRDLGIKNEVAQHQMTSEGRWKLQKTGFDRKIMQDHENPNGLFDRTLLDHFIYCLLWSREKITDTVCKSMMILVQENLAKYDLLFYFSLYDWVVPPDGMREDSFTAKLEWDYLAKGFLLDARVKPIKVPNGAREDRAKMVLENIQNLRDLLEIEAATSSQRER